MAKKIYVDLTITKSVIIDLTGYDVDMTNPESIEEYIDLYARGDIECHEDPVEYAWNVIHYNVMNERKK
jgi:hypothetical protein